ncbi:MAG: hypothetical protein IPM67_01435 [Sphingomonadales bacterium]|jgi:DNA-binding MarR family transcriptional regulator|nr:hypothetical protein [Sphingomonadales bacterium]MBK9267340.1 hypothetical protein [Sphingomonadales bacterium]
MDQATIATWGGYHVIGPKLPLKLKEIWAVRIRLQMSMLVDLFIAAEEGKQISVSSLCIASAVPMTTALRWIAILEAKRLIERKADPLDSRRYFLSISQDVRDKMRDHFETRYL